MDENKLEAIRLWINRDKIAKDKYSVINSILNGSITLKDVKNHLTEVEK